MTERIVPVTPENIRRAAALIRSGGLVAFPTETVYGLGANALDPEAVARIFAAKGRPQDNPLILHVGGVREAALYGEMNEWGEALMRQFWPGPLTVVLYARDGVPEITRGGLDTVALRMPSNAAALALIREAGVPIAAPSANRSGRPSPTTACIVAEDLGDSVDMILDGGPTPVGLESTVVDATEREAVAILRPGGVTREALESIVDIMAGSSPGEACAEKLRRSPGTRHRHYAPRLPLLLWGGEDAAFFRLIRDKRWCYLGLKTPPGGAVEMIVFNSVEEYAQRFYASLRELERREADLIVADLPPAIGIGEALRNRLERAAGR